MSIYLEDVQHAVIKQTKSQDYTTYQELLFLTTYLSPIAFQLYLLLQQSFIEKINNVNYFKSQNLAKILNVSDVHIRKAISELKLKKYALIIKYKKENNPKNYIKIYLGKETVELYNQGIEVTVITDKSFYKEMKKVYNIDNNTINVEEKKKLIDEYNLNYKTKKDK